MKKRINDAWMVGNRILATKFMKRSKTIFIGTLISQLITFLTSFVITAYYTPEDMGLIGTLTALISIVAGTMIFRLDLAIIQEEEPRVFETFVRSTLFSGFCSFIFCLVCFFLPWDWAHKISTHFVAFLLWTWGYFLFFNSKQIPFRFNTLEDASYSSIWRSIYAFVTQMIGGLMSPSFTWLLSSRISSDYLGTIIHLKRYLKRIHFTGLTGSWGAFLKHHKEYFFFISPQHLCTSLSQNIIILFIERRFGLFEAGIFALSQRLIQAPLEMIGGTLMNVTIQRFSELKKDLKGLKSFYLKSIMLSTGLSIFMGITILGTIDLFVPLLGPKWAETSSTIKYLIPYFMSLLIFIPSTNFLRVIKRSKMQLGIEVVEVLMKIVLLSFYEFSAVRDMILAYGYLSLALCLIKTLLILVIIKDLETKDQVV